MIIVVSTFALQTVYKCINLSIFVAKHCQLCHNQKWLSWYFTIIASPDYWLQQKLHNIDYCQRQYHVNCPSQLYIQQIIKCLNLIHFWRVYVCVWLYAHMHYHVSNSTIRLLLLALVTGPVKIDHLSTKITDFLSLLYHNLIL